MTILSLRPGAAALCALALAACQSPGSAFDGTPVFAPLEINIAHINDHHSRLEATPDFELSIDGKPTRVEIGGFPRLAALFKAHRTLPNLLRLHAGDAMTGTLYHTLYKGEADAALMNSVCFDAFTLGNHEFDEGDAGLRKFIDHLHKHPCRTPVLSANVEPAIGTPLAPTASTGFVQPHILKIIDGVTVAIIGITVRGKTVASSRPLPSTVFQEEISSAQRQIDALKESGIRHFVLLTHQGYATDKLMADQLTDVDVIIGGDSHTLLGDFSGVGIAATAGAYPTQVKNRDGDLVCIGQAWEYSKAFGLMQVRFDRQGRVAACTGQAILPLGDDFRQKDDNGRFAPLPPSAKEKISRTLARESSVRQIAPDPQASAELARYSGRLLEMKQQKIGHVDESLCLVRVPGEEPKRSVGSQGCEAAYSLARGSDIAQVVAEAYRQASRLADIALLNGGGIRQSLPGGEITIERAHSVLPFSNTLIELPLTGSELTEVLEDAVANHLDHRLSTGSHPYAAGLRWHLDLSQPRGRRFSRLEVRERDSGEWLPLDSARRYTVVTSDYLAEGGDGYRTLADIHRSGQSVNTYLLYSQTFIDHIRSVGHLRRPPAGDYSHQGVITRDGRVLP